MWYDVIWFNRRLHNTTQHSITEHNMTWPTSYSPGIIAIEPLLCIWYPQISSVPGLEIMEPKALGDQIENRTELILASCRTMPTCAAACPRTEWKKPRDVQQGPLAPTGRAIHVHPQAPGIDDSRFFEELKEAFQGPMAQTVGEKRCSWLWSLVLQCRGWASTPSFSSRCIDVGKCFTWEKRWTHRETVRKHWEPSGDLLVSGGFSNFRWPKSSQEMVNSLWVCEFLTGTGL